MQPVSKWRPPFLWLGFAVLAVGGDGCQALDEGADTPDSTSDVADRTEPDGDREVGEDGGGDTSRAPRDGEGWWLAGDFHVHATGASNDTGGDSYPTRIKEVAEMRGLDFVVLTDHSNSTGSDPSTTEEDPELFNMGPEFPYWEEAAELTDEDFLMIDGNEISPVAEDEGEPTGHIGCYPRSLENFDPTTAFTDRPRGEVDGGEALRQAREARCFTTINHPISLAPWIAYDWTGDDYDALEVWNGTAGFDMKDFATVKAWACDLAQARDILGIGGSDNHRVNIEPPGDPENPPLGQPVTWVYAEELAWEAIVEALDAGRVSISDTGAPMTLDVYGSDGDWLGFTGDSVAADRAAEVRVTGRTKADAPAARLLRIYRVGTDCEDTREPGEITTPSPDWEVVDRRRITPDTSFSVTVDIDLSPGESVFALLAPREPHLNEHNAAFTNAVRAE